MKKLTKKTLILISVLCFSLFALTACGGEEDPAATPNGEETTTTEETPAAEEETPIHEYEDINTTIETDDDYFAALEIFSEAANNLNSDLTNRLAEIDTADSAQVQEVVNTVKKPFTQFLNVTPPAAYETANASYVEACNQILTYIDQVAAGEDGGNALSDAVQLIQQTTNSIADALANAAAQ